MTTQLEAAHQAAATLSSFFSSTEDAVKALAIGVSHAGMDDMLAVGTDTPPSPLDDFLSNLVEESMGQARDRRELKTARKSVKNLSLPGKEQMRLKDLVKDLEYRAEWLAVADVIWVKRCICEQCGGETPQFAGYFRRSRNRHTRVDRWVSLSAEVESALPREMKTEMTSVAMCADCIPQILMEDGWLTADGDATSIEPSDDQPEVEEEDILEPKSEHLPHFRGEANELDAMDNQLSDSDYTILGH